MKNVDGFMQLLRRLKDKKIDRTQCLILVLAGVLVLVIAIPVKKNGGEDAVTTEQGQETLLDSSDEQDDCKQLESILRRIEGVGEVQVLITYQDGGEKVVLQDENSANSTMVETDQAGGSRTTKESSKELATVYDGENDSNGPYVTRETKPTIEGILVVAKGADQTAVKQDIQQAIMALFPVEVNKISIVKMK